MRRWESFNPEPFYIYIYIFIIYYIYATLSLWFPSHRTSHHTIANEMKFILSSSSERILPTFRVFRVLNFSSTPFAVSVPARPWLNLNHFFVCVSSNFSSNILGLLNQRYLFSLSRKIQSIWWREKKSILKFTSNFRLHYESLNYINIFCIE